MTSQFAASLWREGDWIVAQCVEIDVTSQGHTEITAGTLSSILRQAGISSSQWRKL